MPSTYPPLSTPLSTDIPVTASLLTTTLSTPTNGPSGLFTIQSKTFIHTSLPPLDGLNLVRDTKTWPKWNSFTPRCEILASSSTSTSTNKEDEGILTVSTKMNFHVFMDGKGLESDAVTKRKSGEIVTALEEFDVPDASGGEGRRKRKGWRIAWRGTDFPGWMLKAERVLEFVESEKEGEGWEFTSWETFGGPLATVIKFSYGDTLVERFGDYSRDLKAYFENK